MKRGLLAAVIAAGLTASSALATNVNVKVCALSTAICDPDSATPDSISVAPGATVDYKIVAKLTDDVNEGLALIGLSLKYTGGDIGQPANTPTGAITCQNPMPAFVPPDGIANPAGYGGTLIAGDVIQLGGAQNTINNFEENAPFPIGAVITGVAQPAGCGLAVIATGSFNAGATGGQFQGFDVFANVIKDGEDGTVFWATEAAGIGMVTNLTVNVGAAASVLKWESVRIQGAVGAVPLEMANSDLFSEPRRGSGAGTQQLVVTFTSAINPATASPGNVIICGNNLAGSAIDLSGIAVTTAATAGNTKMEINFTPQLPNIARYRVAISGVEATGGGAVVAGDGGLSRVFTMLQGDAFGAAGNQGDRRVNATDAGGVRSIAAAGVSDPIDPAILTEVRADANNDGRVNATDAGGVRSFAAQGAAQDARNIPIPVCP